jgi:TatD DNase family protein
MVPYIDIHSHHPSNRNDIIHVQNLIFPQQKLLPTTCTIGMHPWYIPTENLDSQLIALRALLSHSQIWGVGECGLDKICKTEWNLQIQAFKAQVLLANQFNKPLIIHCVKAFEEVLKILSESKSTVPTIFHGFNKHPQLANTLIKKGYYLSFGEDLKYQKVKDTFKNCPPDRVFLETDQSDLTIAQIYNLALDQSEMELDTVKNQILQNYKNCNIEYLNT